MRIGAQIIGGGLALALLAGACGDDDTAEAPSVEEARVAFCEASSEYVAALDQYGRLFEDTGVTVTALCPGPTASGFQDKADMGHSALVKGKKLPTSEEVAALGYRAMQRGQRVYIPGFMNWALAQSMRFTPRNLATKMVKILTKPLA